MNVLSLFSGIGLLDLGLAWAGMQTVGLCEIEPYCREVLAKHWPGVPIWSDVREVTGERVCRAVTLGRARELLGIKALSRCTSPGCQSQAWPHDSESLVKPCTPSCVGAGVGSATTSASGLATPSIVAACELCGMPSELSREPFAAVCSYHSRARSAEPAGGCRMGGQRSKPTTTTTDSLWLCAGCASLITTSGIATTLRKEVPCEATGCASVDVVAGGFP